MMMINDEFFVITKIILPFLYLPTPAERGWLGFSLFEVDVVDGDEGLRYGADDIFLFVFCCFGGNGMMGSYILVFATLT